VKKPQLTQRILPPKHNKIIDLGWHRAFTMRERWKILFGYCVTVSVRILTEHSPGRISQHCEIKTTKEIDPERLVEKKETV
jgi:hypothetical protein